MAYGFRGLNNRINPSTNNSFNISTAAAIENIIVFGRVKSIVLNDKHPKFQELGGWSALGVIEYELVTNPSAGLNIAYPLNPNIKNHPLLGEIVFIKTFPSIDISKGKSSNDKSSQKSYYSNVALWNHPHHNASPTFPKTVPSSQNKSYPQIQAGSPKVVSSEPVMINLGNTFKERPDIHPLLPFEGDIIHEGRWGNSIRLGSTVMSSASLNPNDWSTSGVGQDGDPIIVIRNGQGNILTNPSTGEDITNQGWVPIIENINSDQSSIYLTSTQNVPLEASSTSYVSYSGSNYTPPTIPNKYSGQQIILSSGRLVFNSSNDHILLSSGTSINLNSKESVNIDTTKVAIQADKIFLGPEYLTKEPLLLGDTTSQLLRSLVASLRELANTLKTAQTSNAVNGVPCALPSINLAAIKLNTQLKALENQLGSSSEDCKITSKRNYTL